MPKSYLFLLKCGGALLLVALADLLFWYQRAGATLGLFAFAVLLTAACLRLDMLARWPARIAVAAAFSFAVALAFDPGPLALLLFAIAIGMAVLLPRSVGFDDGFRWAQRLMLYGVLSPVVLPRDLLILRKARRRRGGIQFTRTATLLIVPIAGSLIFFGLFAAANPLIEQTLANIGLDIDLDLARFIFWGILLGAVWTLLRPPRFVLPVMRGADPAALIPGLGLASTLMSLLAFNAVFALQNGLDLAFLWSGAPLPNGMTMAEYAHRGAYPLIVTALLAALFVLVALRPGSATAASRPVRLLVTLWIAQNILLVASSILRTLDYIGAYSLTELRIAALIWMGLVALGLALICWRLLAGKSAAWLINANLLAAALVLAACCWVDFGGIVARWNSADAREAGGTGAALDLCYLEELGPASLPPLIQLEDHRLDPVTRIRISGIRTRLYDRLRRNQADWHGWTPQNARRLAEADALAAGRHFLLNHRRDVPCDWRPGGPATDRDSDPYGTAYDQPADAVVAPAAIGTPAPEAKPAAPPAPAASPAPHPTPLTSHGRR